MQTLQNMKQSILGSISPDDFLNDHWQKKPLLIRQAIPNFQTPLSSDELAELALEDEVESRIIIENGATPWELKQGPFTEESFAGLPDNHWTLLVQAVDHWVPEIHALLEEFYFLPRWRVDDIMISYASDGGNVGPHFDQYDVFLLQAEGQRRWQIGPVYDSSSETIKGTPLHILSEFETLDEYILEPGDMLYLPPGVGHHGVALGECMTISVGFRAPSHRDILMQFTDFVADRLPESKRYSDADQLKATNPAEIDDKALDRLQSILHEYTENRELLGQWFGEMMTQPKYEHPIETLYNDWPSLINEMTKAPLWVSENARLATRHQQNRVVFFANGQTTPCTSAVCIKLAETLCDQSLLASEDLYDLTDTESQSLILDLLNRGVLYMNQEI